MKQNRHCFLILFLKLAHWYMCMLNHFSCVLTLCNLLYYSQPGSSVDVIFQRRILEWIAFPSLGDLPDPEMEPAVLYH